ncbi:transglycosylase SLT domain-containing protein [Photobacterium sanguinicancri]|uniref:transglycosylase SLT domain-containing protein n=1 Tax=Photobacterium sanguinicancri TaxID=875932 RepID=UPI0024814D59|nr:transglycosylase SLT domain-containing protein [Photobacterium sanguinicancri]
MMLIKQMQQATMTLVLAIFVLNGCQSIPKEPDQAAIKAEQDLLALNRVFKPVGKLTECKISHHQFDGSYIATGKVPHYLYNSPVHNHIAPVLADEATRHQYDMWDTLAANMEMPIPNNRRIRYYRKWFITKPEHIDTVTTRAQPFLFYIYEQVEARDLPMELVLLPFIESSFDQFAYSSQGASGLWQITRATGKTFGLKYWQGYDGRRDIIASTDAALDLLEYLHKKFKGNWLHAIAAYNTGEGRVRNAIKKNRAAGKPTDFWSLQLPKETRLYVPKLLAMSSIIQHKNHYGLQLNSIKPQPVVSEVIINKRVKLKTIAKDAKISSKVLYALNPGYTGGYTVKGRDNKLLLPRDALTSFYNRENVRYTKYRFHIHQIKPGDSLNEIAQLNNTTVSLLRQLNDLTGSFITAGQQLIIPPR